MRLHWLLPAALIAAAPARADRDADLAAAAAATAARSEAMIDSHVTRPFPAPAPDPGSPALGNAAYALAALWQGTDSAGANGRIVEIRDGAFADEYWAMGQIVRIHGLFHCDSEYRPGRLTPEALEAIRDVVRRHLDLYSVRDEAFEPTAFVIDGSENHDVMRRTANLLGAAILAADPAEALVPIADGRLPADHRDAWSDFFVRYLQERARKGLFVERGSPTYSKYTLQSIFNLRDFAPSGEVRELAARLIDLYFADAAHEVIEGVRGGAKSRSYHDRSSSEGTSDSLRAYTHVLAGSPASLPLTQHPSALCAATSEHRLPREILDLVLFPQDKGAYSYSWRAPGKGTREVLPGTLHYHAEFPADLLGTTIATPSWIAGAHLVDPRATYMQIQSQNRWFGAIFSGSPNTRVHAQCEGRDSGGRSAYDEMWGLAEGDAIVLQRLPQSSGGPMRVYFSNDLVREEAGGWVFARDPLGDGMIGVRPARGGFTWDPADPEFPLGTFLRPDDPASPVILQLGRSADFAAFQAQVQSNALAWPAATEMRYVPGTGREITWRTDRQLPSLDGVRVDLNPPKSMSSPFADWDFDALSGTVTSTAAFGARTRSLDFSLPLRHPPRVVLEAESAEVVAPMILQPDVAASGRWQAQVPDSPANSGGALRFTFETAEDAEWHLWARVLWTNGGSNSFLESVDGEAPAVLGNGAASGTWQWIRGASRSLAAGSHELLISNREDGSKIDQVVLVTDRSDAPPLTVIRSLADSDADGVPDAWSQAEFGHAGGLASDLSRASDDRDGDGETTLQEYLAGTDPGDPADSLLLRVDKPGGSPAIRFDTRDASGPQCPPPARRYAVLTATSGGGPWSSVPGLDDLAAGAPVARALPRGTALDFFLVDARLRFSR